MEGSAFQKFLLKGYSAEYEKKQFFTEFIHSSVLYWIHQ